MVRPWDAGNARGQRRISAGIWMSRSGTGGRCDRSFEGLGLSVADAVYTFWRLASRNKAAAWRPAARNMSKEEEAAFLAPFFDQATQGGILIVSEIKRALDERIGRKTAVASVYNLLHRHNWRKLAPDKRHPQADVEAQLEWKKNSRNSSG